VLLAASSAVEPAQQHQAYLLSLPALLHLLHPNQNVQVASEVLPDALWTTPWQDAKVFPVALGLRSVVHTGHAGFSSTFLSRGCMAKVDEEPFSIVPSQDQNVFFAEAEELAPMARLEHLLEPA